MSGASARRPVTPKHVFLALYGLTTLFVLYRYEMPFLDAKSPIWEHFAKVTWWLVPHGVAGALALFIAPFQFSTRLRQRYLRLHRILGRVYVASVPIAASVGIYIAVVQGPPSLVMAAAVQSGGWMLTTAIAFYCVRTGKIQQHREWMIRSYPFAMVFVVARAVIAIPAIERMGEVGIVSTVWKTIALACFVPTLVINWRRVFPDTVSKPAAVSAQSAVSSDRAAATL